MCQSLVSTGRNVAAKLLMVCFFSWAFLAQAQAPNPPSLSHKEFKEVIPLTLEHNKIFLRAKLNGQEFRFILDSGSPTVITQQAAEAVGLKPVGAGGESNTGTDANGQAVTMLKYKVDVLQLGELAFKDFTALVFDPSNLSVGSCVLDGGVIGSDLFPAAAWQINVDSKTLTVANTVKALSYVKESKAATAVPLLQFGYPYAPIFDYKVGKHLSDKLLFDTGAPTFFSLAKPAYDALIKSDSIQGSLVGRGYAEESAVRLTIEQDVFRAAVEELALGKLKLNKVDATVRHTPPSLLGVGLLKTHIVTLDYPNKTAYFHKLKTPHRPLAEAPVQFRMDGSKVQVSYIAKGSHSERQGVQLGHTVWAINGVDVSTINDENRCEKVRWLLSLKYNPQIEYTLMVNGLEQKIVEKNLAGGS